MGAPPAWIIEYALALAARSTCRSCRGVVIYAPGAPVGGRLGRLVGEGHNGPPPGFACPGRALCTGTCGQRSVHAEMRALRGIDAPGSQLLDLVHVELGADGGVVACDGPRCVTCSREIADVGAIGRVWLYEAPQKYPAGVQPRSLLGFQPDPPQGDCWWRWGADWFWAREDGRDLGERWTTVVGRAVDWPAWRSYSAEGFHRATLIACGLEAP